MTTTQNGVDHVLLLKVKIDATPEELKKFTDGVCSLTNIRGVLSAVAGDIFMEPWLQDRRQGFTHYLRIRLDSRESLKSYQDVDAHVKVRDECIKPILVAPPMAVDCDAPLLLAPSVPNQTVNGVDHILLLKLKEDLSHDQFTSLTKGIQSLTDIPGVISALVGETFIEPWLQDRRQGMSHYVRIRLENRDALKHYQSHELHVRVKDECIVPLVACPPMAVDCDCPIQFA
jgi:hypothetical protein